MSTSVALRSQVLRPQSFGELAQFADMAARSALVPRDYQGKPENIMLAVQMGSELGLAPMQAIQNIAVVNGRPTVWGDAMIGLCRASDVCKSITEWMDGDVAYCKAERVNGDIVTASFSMEDAKKAGLLGKQGPWTQYPRRMLQMRARGFALRDAFPDVLKGLISAEEARDIPAEPVRVQAERVDDYRPNPNAEIEHVLSAEPQEQPKPVSPLEYTNATIAQIGLIETEDDYHAWIGSPKRQKLMDRLRDAYPGFATQVEDAENEAAQRLGLTGQAA